MIKKTVCYDSSPALHIAEARVIELPSGTSLAQFLMVFLTLEALFIVVVALCGTAKKRLKKCYQSAIEDAIGRVLQPIPRRILR